MDDAELMGRVQSGDEAALGELMARWEVPVKSVVARIVQNVSEAGDLAQEAFVRVWEQRGKFRPGAEFRPWVFAIAVNLARNRLRWWRRRPLVSLEAWTEGAPRRTPQDEREGVAKVERSERAAAVQAAVASLPGELRDAVVLSEYEQLLHAEIALVVGCTPKAVETRLYRARAALRKTLAGKI